MSESLLASGNRRGASPGPRRSTDGRSSGLSRRFIRWRILLRHLAALLFAAAVGSASAHGTVEAASPRNGETLTAPPSEIRLRFNEPLEPTCTSVKLFGPSGQEVTMAEKARVEGGRTVVLPLPRLALGAYKAQWMSVGHDGHPVHGELVFTVK